MITIPSVLVYKDITVYPDDKDCNVFYCIRTTPRIRVENGVPVFSGLFYTDKADGKMESTSGIAGALINFDGNLAISDEEYDKIREQLKAGKVQEARVRAITKKNEERQYYRNRVKDKDGNSVMDNDPTGYDIPTVDHIRFGSIHFKEGTVELLEESGGDFVAWSSSGGRCSGFGDNNAAFALRLTHLGGAVWYKALKNRSKAFSIRYNLKMDVRVPALEIRIYATSYQNSEIERSVKRFWENVDNGCTDADVERIDCTSVAQTLVDEGVINIEIVQGSSDIPMEDVNKIRESMVSIIKGKVEEIIKSKIQGLTREQMETSMIQTLSEEINSFAELRFTQESVIEWSVSPQGTIMNFLENVPQTALDRVVKVVDLSDNEFATNEVRVQASAPWDTAPFVTSIRVDLEYEANGAKESFSLTKEKPMDTWRFRKPKNDKGVVKYKAFVYMQNHTEPYEMEERHTTGHVFVNVGKLGIAELRFTPHPIVSTLSGNNKVTSICVDTRYQSKKALAKGDAGVKDSFTLKPEETEGFLYTKDFGTALTEPLLYTVTYYFKNRAPVETKTMQYYFTDEQAGQVVTPSPFGDSLEINVDISGKVKKDESVERAIVSFRYVDNKNNFESTASVTLSKEDDWETARASIAVLEKESQKFQYKYMLMLKDDDPYQSTWIDGEGEAETVIISMPDLLTVDTGMLGTAGTDYYRGELVIRFENKEMEEVELRFDSDENKKIRKLPITPLSSEEPLKFSYEFTYYDLEGEEHVISGEKSGKLLMITKPKVTEAHA